MNINLSDILAKQYVEDIEYDGYKNIEFHDDLNPQTFTKRCFALIRSSIKKLYHDDDLLLIIFKNNPSSKMIQFLNKQGIEYSINSIEKSVAMSRGGVCFPVKC